jgi:riboflavin kinase/FMN adenylyltransferase
MKKSIITIGTFDGLHKGHQHLISNLISLSKKLALRPIVLTFPMPVKFYMNKDKFQGSLTTTLEKMQLLRQWVEDVYLLDFEEVRSLEPDEFINKILIEKYFMKAIIIGYDFRFGKSRKGDYNYLLANSYDLYEVFRSNEYKIGSDIVSSSKIRTFIKEGEMEKANFFLGRNYSIKGVVTKGIQLARKIGFPTANLDFDPYKVVPKPGVYFVKTTINLKTYNSIAYVRPKPNRGSSVEAHIFDFNGNIYSKSILVEFVKFIRNPMKFSNIDRVRDQIKKDINYIRKYLELI